MFGQTPLHLAVGRPTCLRLLLQGPGSALLDQPDFSGYTPLEYAALCCNESCSASVVVMLESDCRVPNQFSRIFSKLCKTCKRELLKHIRNRRERLKRFALEKLPAAESSVLGLNQAAILDSKTNLVTQALEKRGYEIPSPLRLDMCPPDMVCRFDAPNVEYNLYQSVSMFHQSPLNTLFGTNFDALLELGFRDFEDPPSVGLSPLLSWLTRPLYVSPAECDDWEANRIKACIWLIEHGANLWDTISEDIPATTAHYLYGSLYFWEPRIPIPPLGRLKVQFLTNTLSTHDVRDGCHCRCALGGCSPFVWFLKRGTGPDNPWWGRYEHGTFDEFPSFLHRWKPIISLEQLRSAVRFLTFELLGVRHTCSHDYTKVDKPTADEIEELMSEDAWLVELLEDLIEKFESELQSFITPDDPLGMPFWATQWPERMKEVLAQLSEYKMEEDELLSAQQLGVTWRHFDDSEGRLQVVQEGGLAHFGPEMDGEFEADSVRYRESDWSVEVDDVKMWRTLRSPEDWRSRLDLIMSRAIPDWR